MRKLLVGLFSIFVILCVSYGIYLRPIYSNVDNTIPSLDSYRLTVEPDLSLYMFELNNKQPYLDAFQTETVAKVIVKSRKSYGSLLVSNAKVLDVYLGSIKTKNIRIVEEFYIEDTNISSPGLYIPMTINKEYIVNIKKAAIKDLYLLTTPDFSCYPLQKVEELLLGNTSTTLSPEQFNNDVFLNIDPSYYNHVENSSIYEYIDTRKKSFEKAYSLLNIE